MPVPVTLPDARRQVKLEAEDTVMDHELTQFIADAVSWVEDYTGHILVARDVVAQSATFDTLTFREWPIGLAAVPVLTYAAAGGETMPVPLARIDRTRRPATIRPGVGGRWPGVPDDTIVTATLRAGYEADEAVPGAFRRAILMLIGAYDADREGGDIIAKAEATARTLLRSYRPMAL